MNITRTIGSP